MPTGRAGRGAETCLVPRLDEVEQRVGDVSDVSQRSDVENGEVVRVLAALAAQQRQQVLDEVATRRRVVHLLAFGRRDCKANASPLRDSFDLLD